MKCNNCGYENPSGNAICNNCGQALNTNQNNDVLNNNVFDANNFNNNPNNSSINNVNDMNSTNDTQSPNIGNMNDINGAQTSSMSDMNMNYNQEQTNFNKVKNKKPKWLIPIIVFVMFVIAIITIINLASSNDVSTASASNLDYFEIIDGELTGLTELGAKQKVLVIPESVTSIKGRAFAIDEYGETNDVLEKVSFLNPDTQLSVNTFVYNYALKEIELPANLVEIPKGLLSHCESLESIVIPDSVTSIGESAFYEDFALKTVEFGSSLISIGEEAFYGCTSLTTLEFNEGLETIGEKAFANTGSIKSVTIPESVNYIASNAFDFSDSGTVKVYVKEGSWADINFDSYKTLNENVQKVYY